MQPVKNAAAQGDEPLVSVLIPTYNAERFVESAVRSIMQQTYTNMEILIADDCSTDGTYNILQKLADEDARIKLCKNETNLKIAKSLNRMILRACGTYIARMDADDISLPQRIEKQVAFLQANPDIALCGTNVWEINEHDACTGFSRMPSEAEQVQTIRHYMCPFWHPSVMARAEVFKENPFDESFVPAEDYELWARILSKHKAFNLPERLVLYRRHSEQTSVARKEVQRQKADAVIAKYGLLPPFYVETEKKLLSRDKVSRAKKKEYAEYTKNFITGNPAADIALLHKLFRLRVFVLSAWSIRVGFASLKYFFQKIFLLLTRRKIAWKS